jgi:hypothetical protein
MSEKILLKAIRARCLDCCCEMPKEVRLCPISDCALHPYRLGKKPPSERRKMNGKQLEALKLANKTRLKKQAARTA